jgi:hypothetical protein
MTEDLDFNAVEQANDSSADPGPVDESAQKTRELSTLLSQAWSGLT